MDDDDKARALFKLLPLSAKRVKLGKRMTANEVRLLKTLFPDTYNLCKVLSFDEMIALDMKYKDHKIHGENVRIMLSPEGRIWLKDSLEKIKGKKEDK